MKSAWCDVGIKNGPTSGIGLFGFWVTLFQWILQDVYISVFAAAVIHQEIEIGA